jgi:predicted transposase/invertase (TIGR01784 family)
LQIGREDIDSKVKGVWKMRFRPIDEVVRDIYMRDAREEGREEGIEEVARNLLANGVPLDIIAKSSGLSLDDVRGLAN